MDQELDNIAIMIESENYWLGWAMVGDTEACVRVCWQDQDQGAQHGSPPSLDTASLPARYQTW